MLLALGRLGLRRVGDLLAQPRGPLARRFGRTLLDQLDAGYILVSYPAHSLGGRSKGMVKNYAAAFQEMVAGQPWTIQRFDFPGELAFLIHKKQ